MTDKNISVLSQVDFEDLAYNISSKGIDTVKKFIKAMDDYAADCDFTNELYKFVCEMWNEMNESIVATGDKPLEGYNPAPVNITLNINGANEAILKEIKKAAKENGVSIA